jgi:uncharacterized protein (DUF1800 family)
MNIPFFKHNKYNMSNSKQRWVWCFSILFIASYTLVGQVDTIVLGLGNYPGVTVTASDNFGNTNPENTINQDGYLPNLAAASRFLGQATIGYSYNDIEQVADMGIEDWIENQTQIPIPFTLESQVKAYRDFARTNGPNPDQNSNNRMWNYAWWQYHMTSNDALRQKVAFALSQILVISENSSFVNNGFALSDYYDILLDHSFGNFRDLIAEITFHPSMGVYLTYLNNPKSDLANNQFPDENYARELMQLFTIGLYELNNDGTRKVDTNGEFIPTYDNDDITEFSKIFTGLTWADRTNFGQGSPRDTSYTLSMQMWNDEHEPGEKLLLNNQVVPNRDPVDGIADIDDALDNLFNHPNVGPFIGTLLIQRMVTSNPSPSYVDRVSTVFNDNGQGVRGDLKAVITAILLDPEAKSCSQMEDPVFGKLSEPFVRYFQINKAFNASTLSGNFRNNLSTIYGFVAQKPLASPSVFNFYQYDYQPLGPVTDNNLFAPEFQIANSQTIAGWIDGLYQFIINENAADEFNLYSGESNVDYADEFTKLDFSSEILYTDDEELHILLDRLNLILAGGRLSETATNLIVEAVKEFPNNDVDDKEIRAKLAIYLVMSSPEYLITK